MEERDAPGAAAALHHSNQDSRSYVTAIHTQSHLQMVRGHTVISHEIQTLHLTRTGPHQSGALSNVLICTPVHLRVLHVFRVTGIFWSLSQLSLVTSPLQGNTQTSTHTNKHTHIRSLFLTLYWTPNFRKLTYGLWKLLHRFEPGPFLLWGSSVNQSSELRQ